MYLRKKTSILILSLLAGALGFSSAPAHGYVTSAVLEYSAANRVRFYVNGVQLKGGKDWQTDHMWDYAVYSSSDGTLPLGLFKNNSDNVLAAENWSQHMPMTYNCWQYYYTDLLAKLYLSYRLTVYQSSGDPIVVWSEPGNAKMFHLVPGQALPASWENPKFDDTAWTVAKTTRFEQEYLLGPELEDPHFTNFLVMGVVPFVSNNANGSGTANTKNLFRSHFQISNSPGLLKLGTGKTDLRRGETTRISLVPDRDASFMEKLQVQVYVPQGMEPVMTAGGRFDSASRWLTWAYPRQLTVTTTTLNGVVKADGWVHPERAFGPFKPHKDSERAHVAPGEYTYGAGFQSGSEAWYRMAPTSMQPGPNAPRITGVIFHSQAVLGNCNTAVKSNLGDNADHFYFNYSLDGSMKDALPKSADLSRFSNTEYYMDFYYDASNDREWTWQDVNNLQVHFKDVQARSRKVDEVLSSCEMSVTYYTPSRISPSVDLQVTEPGCKKVTLWARVWDPVSNSLSQKSAAFDLNAAICIPTATPTRTRTPVPTRTFTPRPTPTKVPTPKPGIPTYTPVPPTATDTRTPLPTVTPRPTVTKGPNDAVSVTGMSSNPEPFKRGGVFVYFSLSGHGSVQLKVMQGSTVVRTVKGGEFDAGKNQLFYNGLGDNGRLLLPGSYTYEIWATGTNGVPGRAKSTFTKVEDSTEDVR